MINIPEESDIFSCCVQVAFKMAIKKHSGEISKNTELALADW